MTSFDVMWCYVVSCGVMGVVRCYVLSYADMWRYVALFGVMRRYVGLGWVMWRYVALCNGM